MPLPPIPAQPFIIKALDVIQNAMMEIGALSQGETASAGDAAFCLSKFNRIVDQWNARRLYAYSVNFSNYTLTPNHQPHTIGPNAADFAVAQRPVQIVNANLILTTTNPQVRIPLNIRDDDWWAANQVQTIATTIPTDLYYSPDFPNGQIFLWPIPTQANKLELETWVPLAKAVLTDTLVLPPGYEDAITLTLAESLCPSFEKTPNAILTRDASKARATVQALNAGPSNLRTMDYGMPGGTRKSGFFNWLTGGLSNK